MPKPNIIQFKINSVFDELPTLNGDLSVFLTSSHEINYGVKLIVNEPDQFVCHIILLGRMNNINVIRYEFGMSIHIKNMSSYITVNPDGFDAKIDPQFMVDIIIDTYNTGRGLIKKHFPDHPCEGLFMLGKGKELAQKFISDNHK